jgi:hypothetical protein
MDVTSFKLERDACRGLLVVLRVCEDGDFGDRYGALGDGSLAVASKRMPVTGKVRAQIDDRAGALLELEALRAVLGEPGWYDFARVATHLQTRGWLLDEARSQETCLDEPGWAIQAARAGDLLVLGMTMGSHGAAVGLELGDFDFVALVGQQAQVFARLVSGAQAEHLVLAF